MIIALYHLAYIKTSSSKDYWTPASRTVSVAYAKALLPSLVIGYLVPTIAMYIPWNNIFTTQALAALWQPSPWIVNILLVMFSTLYSIGGSETKVEPEGTTADVKYLQRVYLLSFAVSAISHWLTIATIFFSKNPNLTFTHVFLPSKELFLATQSISTLHEGLHYIFQIDYWIIFGSSLIWAYLAILDTNRVAQSYVAPMQAVSVMALNTVLFGPAATVAAIWHSREGTLAGLQKSKAV